MDTNTTHNPTNPINYKETPEDRNANKNTLIFEKLNELSDKYFGDTITEYLNATMQEDLISYNDADELFNDLQDNGYFNEEIIYYHTAIDYLKENDASLSESLEIATEYGYTLENLNSEILASLHASKKKEETYFEYIAEEINEILES